MADRERIPGYLEVATAAIDGRAPNAILSPPRNQFAARFDAARAIAETAVDIAGALTGAPITDVDREAEIAPASDGVADALGVSYRTPVLADSYTWRLETDAPVEAGVICYRVDCCKFRCESSFSRAPVKVPCGTRAGGGLA
jgi:hypothetical protein